MRRPDAMTIIRITVHILIKVEITTIKLPAHPGSAWPSAPSVQSAIKDITDSNTNSKTLLIYFWLPIHESQALNKRGAEILADRNVSLMRYIP